VPLYAIFVREGNGVSQATDEPERYWPSAGPGGLSQATLAADSGRALSELADYADKLIFVKGVDFGFPGNGCGHSGGGNQVLTAAKVSAVPSGNESLAEGESIDNRIVTELGAAGVEPLTLYAGRKPGYLDEVLSYRGPQQLRAAQNNPYEAYLDLFGLGNVDAEELERLRLRRQSVNDAVRGEMTALMSNSKLSKTDLERLDLHFSSIRDLEQGIICGLSDGEVANLEAIAQNVDNDDYIEQVMKLQYDVIALTMACGVTRAATLQIGCGNDQTQYLIDGVKQKPFHKISHRIDSDGSEGPAIPNADVLHHKIDRLLLQNFKYLLDRLSAYDLGSGTLLDFGVAVWLNDLADKYHSYDGVPYIMAGSCNGFLKTGQYVDVGDVNNNKLFNTIGTALGCKSDGKEILDDFGDPELEGGLIPEIMT